MSVRFIPKVSNFCVSFHYGLEKNANFAHWNRIFPNSPFQSMTISVLKSKIHCATVTEANLHYMGSITIDEDLMDAAGILPHEHVHIVNNMNGERIETYVIRGPRGTGCICLNGAAARKCQVGDEIIIMSYADMTPDEARGWEPTVVFPDESNRL